MKNSNRNITQNSDPGNDWLVEDDFTNPSITEETQDDVTNMETTTEDDVARRLFVSRDNDEDEDEDEDEDDDDDRDDDDDEEEEEDLGDWGHIDPAESNSPFPDPNAPSAPGSAV